MTTETERVLLEEIRRARRHADYLRAEADELDVAAAYWQRQLGSLQETAS